MFLGSNAAENEAPTSGSFWQFEAPGNSADPLLGVAWCGFLSELQSSEPRLLTDPLHSCRSLSIPSFNFMRAAPSLRVRGDGPPVRVDGPHL